MTDKEQIRKRRDQAVSVKIEIGEDDRAIEMISRADGMYVVSLQKILRINLPDGLDPQLVHADAPIVQTLVVRQGSRSPLVARTILQAKEFFAFLPPKKRSAVENVAWEVMTSLLGFDRIIDRIAGSITAQEIEILQRHDEYVLGSSPRPLPIVDGVEVDFRSAVLTANHTLNTISELFPILFDCQIKRGRFDLLTQWSEKTFGTDDLLSRMLAGDQRWIRLWGEVRNAFEHPRAGYFVTVNNFRLLPNREIQLPTWQLQHPDIDASRPQNMVDALRFCRDNILGLFENLLLMLTDKTIRLPGPLLYDDLSIEERDPDCPKRYKIVGVPLDQSS